PLSRACSKCSINVASSVDLSGSSDFVGIIPSSKSSGNSAEVRGMVEFAATENPGVAGSIPALSTERLSTDCADFHRKEICVNLRNLWIDRPVKLSAAANGVRREC